jgi:glycosyltransferase involved in cell wall biosynthesis
MNVLFLSYNGLLEPILPSQAIPYLKGLVKKGHTFTLLTYEKKRDLTRVGSSGVHELQVRLRRDSIEWRYLRYHKNPPLISTLFDLCAGAMQVLAIIRTRKIEIVHVRGITPGMLILMIARFIRVKILFDMRGLLAEEYVGGGMWKEDSAQFKFVKMAEKRLLMRADAVTVLTRKHLDLNRSLDYLTRRNIPMDVIPCCVDTSKFVYAKPCEPNMRELPGLKNKFILMYPGKIGSFYLIDEMFDFFRSLLVTIPDAVFLIVTHDESGILNEAARKYGIPREKLAVKTNVPFDEMPSYIRIADAGIFFINPYKKIGSSPIKMGEFLASGVPVIINPGVGDTEEIVREERIGVVVGSFNDDAYKAAIDELISLRQDKAALRKRCADTAKKYLSLEKAIDKYATMYELLRSQTGFP